MPATSLSRLSARSKIPRVIACIICCPIALLLPVQAQAYVGPGLGLGTLGVILGLLGSVFLALFAVFWYPLKRRFIGDRNEEEDEEGERPAESSARPQELSSDAEEK